jgi:hypothetical protein
MPVLAIWAVGLVGAAIAARVLFGEWTRINADLDDNHKRDPDNGTRLPNLKRDPKTGVYRPE